MKKSLLLLPVLLLFSSACSDSFTRSSSCPLVPVQAYERLLVGNLEADYVGDDNCMQKCHVHEKLWRDFQASIHGEQISKETGLPLVNCESCHGPGSLAVAEAEKENKCNAETLLQIDDFPAQAQSLLCLKCHSAASTANLAFWNASVHATSEVSCFDCHKLHQGPAQKVSRRDMDRLCFNCHPQVKAEFAQFSHHPLPEGHMACTDCHNPHGSTQEKFLKGESVRQMCTRCHMEFQGPFIYEHADLTENCINCHHPHGSPNNPLLNVAQPFLCMQCHTGHLGENYPTLTTHASKAAYYTRCTDCHTSIHGTDIPSAKGQGTFISR